MTPDNINRLMAELELEVLARAMRNPRIGPKALLAIVAQVGSNVADVAPEDTTHCLTLPTSSPILGQVGKSQY